MTTPEISETQAPVRMRTRVENQGDQEAPVIVTSTIRDHEWRVVAGAGATSPVTIGGEHEFDQQMVVREPRLWSVGSPRRYQVVSKVNVGGRTVDHEVTPLGIRSIKFTKDRGSFLNGGHVDI